MTSRRDLLELLADSGERWQQVHGRYSYRRPAGVTAPAGVRLRRGNPPEPPVRRGATDLVSYEFVAVSHPFRLRLTRTSPPTGGGTTSDDAPDLVVDDGEHLWWQRGQQVQRRQRQAMDAITRTLESTLLPRGLVAAHRLALVGDELVDGRAAVRVQANPVLDPPLAGPGAGSVGELLVDAGTGVLLRQEWRRADVVVMSASLEQVRYEGVVDPDVFVFEPAEGIAVVPGVRVPGRYGPALVVGLLLAAAGETAAQLQQAVLSRVPGRRR